jgi:hypothetical protein
LFSQQSSAAALKIHQSLALGSIYFSRKLCRVNLPAALRGDEVAAGKAEEAEARADDGWR